MSSRENFFSCKAIFITFLCGNKCHQVKEMLSRRKKSYQMGSNVTMRVHSVISLLCESCVIFRNQISHMGPNIVKLSFFKIFFIYPENFSNLTNYRERWWHFILYWQKDDALYSPKVNIYDLIYTQLSCHEMSKKIICQ